VEWTFWDNTAITTQKSNLKNPINLKNPSSDNRAKDQKNHLPARFADFFDGYFAFWGLFFSLMKVFFYAR
jgi:hypothetical protein